MRAENVKMNDAFAVFVAANTIEGDDTTILFDFRARSIVTSIEHDEVHVAQVEIVPTAGLPLAATVRSSPPLFCSTTVPDSPDTVPPTVKKLVTQVIWTVVTSAPLIVPLPFVTVHVWKFGWVRMVAA